MSYMSRAEEFRDEFNKLEKIVKVVYAKEYEEFLAEKRNVPWKYSKPTSAVKYVAEKLQGFSKIKDELDYCVDVRNVLSHKPTIDEKYIVEPSEDVIKLIKNVRYRIENPVRASKMMIKKKDMFYCGL